MIHILTLRDGKVQCMMRGEGDDIGQKSYAKSTGKISFYPTCVSLLWL